MKIRFTYQTLLPITLLLLSQAVFGQAVGDYRSTSTGDWSNVARWERWDGGAWITPAPSAPTSTDGVITIQNGHNITVGISPVTADQIVVDAGGTLTVNNTLTVDDGTGTDLSVLGTVTLGSTLTAGTGTPAATVSSVIDWVGGTLGLATTIDAAGVMNVTTNNKTLTTTLTNNGTINWSASQIAFNNATLDNNLTINASGVTSLNSGGGTNAFNNNASGTFNKITNAGNVTFNIPVNNAGTIDIAAGSILSTSVTGTFANTGSISFSGGNGLTLSGTLAGNNQLDAGTSVSGTGTLTITSATDIDLALSLPSSVSFVLNSISQVLGGSGSLALNGASTWTSGTLSVPTTINSGGTLTLSGSSTKSLTTTLTNDGTISWTGLNLGFNNGTLVNNSTFTATGDNAFTHSAGTNTFTNNSGGTFTKITGTGNSTFNIGVNNAGTIDISSGTFLNTGVNASFTNSGTINFSGGAMTLSGGNTASNDFDAGTSLTGTGTLSLTVTNAINLALSVPSTVTLSFGGSTQTLGGTGSLTINGTYNWSLGTMSIPLTIASGGTFNSTAGKTMAANLTNNGTINLTDPNPASGSISLNNSTFTNNGTINDNYSTAARTFTNGGPTNSFANNGLYIKTNNSFSTSFGAGVPVTNGASGIFRGIGTITFTGGITNTGSIVPGTSPGILAMSANAITGNSPTIVIEVHGGGGPGVGHDRLDLSAATDISGATLSVADLPAAPFPASYTVMTVPGINGFIGTFALVEMPPEYTLTIDNASDPSAIILNKTAATLPVIWGEFTALEKNGKVDLKWSTLQEENTSHFLVQHSVDGNTFTTIGTVAAQGNSSSTVYYSQTHNSPDLTKTNMYRIGQVDLDGKTKYSAIRAVRFNNGLVAAVLVTPNPVTNMMQLSIQRDNIQIMLSGPSGTILNTWKFQKGRHDVSLGHLPPGIYQISIYQKGERIDVQKIVKL